MDLWSCAIWLLLQISRVTFHNTSILFPKAVKVSGDFISVYKMSLDVPVTGVLYCNICCGTGPPPTLPPSILYPKQTSPQW